VISNISVDPDKPLKVPADSYNNPLSCDKRIVTVGATHNVGEAAGTPEAASAYTGSDPNTVMFADSTLGDIEGTSFAAPKVAAAIAGLHKDMPDAPNESVENILLHNLTHSLTTGVTVLDSAKVTSLMSHHDYNFA